MSEEQKRSSNFSSKWYTCNLNLKPVFSKKYRQKNVHFFLFKLYALFFSRFLLNPLIQELDFGPVRSLCLQHVMTCHAVCLNFFLRKPQYQFQKKFPDLI
jgi:hypothetical protein